MRGRPSTTPSPAHTQHARRQSRGGDPCGGGSAKCSIGNEDGAHKIVADLFQVLNDHGFTIPPQGHTCWNDEAMGSRDFKDLDQTHEAVASTTEAAARNAVDRETAATSGLSGVLLIAPNGGT